ncbi:recombination protein NinB [[Clostridium] innocuum]|nr:recombination protein NinB [[Clostridium] innocuum]
MAKQKIIATFQRRTLTEDGDMEITFKVDKHSYNWISACKSLETQPYALEISKPRSKRSIKQNKLLWKIIHDIAEQEDGHLANDWDTYCALLELAGAKYEDLAAPEEAEETFRKVEGLRAIKILRHAQQEGYLIYRLYPGSSTYDTKEMTKLIDVALDYAAKIGLDTAYYGYD